MTSHSATSLLQQTVVIPRGLVRLCSQAQSQLWGLRLGRMYGFGVGFSYALLAFAAPLSLDTAAKLWVGCLGTASWVAGVGALSLSTDLVARDATQGFTSLLRLRGYGESQVERARVVAGALRLATTVLIPGLLLAVAILLRIRTLPAALLALALCLFTVPYAALVGGVLSPLARSCHRLLPSRGRWLFALLTLGPWLVGVGLDAPVPSIPGAFAWVLSNVAGSFH